MARQNIDKVISVEFTQAQLAALLKGCQVANSLALHEELPDFYDYRERGYDNFIEGVERLHDALGRLMGIPV